MTNGFPLVIPTGAKKCGIGANPITLAAPAQNGDSFVLDMATSTVAFGKLEMQALKGLELPNGWACDSEGQLTNDVSAAMSDGGLFPLGGPEVTSGYKGYGLGVMAEVMTGILAGSSFGPWLKNWKNSREHVNYGQCFMVIDPGVFSDGFEGRLQTLLDFYRQMEPADSSKPVQVAGDPEKNHMSLCNDLGGIPYHPNLISKMDDLADKYHVDKLVR